MQLSFPGGETKAAALKRARQAIENFLLTKSHSKVAIATHGGIIRFLVHSCLPEESEPVPIPNCIVYQLCFERTNNSLRFEGKIE